MAIRLKITGGKRIARLRKRVLRLAKNATKQLPEPAKRINDVLLGFVLRRFAAARKGKPPADWPALSPFTLFIRRHRASRKGSRGSDPKMLNDSGALALFNQPFIRRGGTVFGIENRLPYASAQNFGGKGKGGTVHIAPFDRPTPGGGTARVRGYSMRIKPGHKIPKRRFFPVSREYIPMIRRVLTDYEQQIAGGF